MTKITRQVLQWLAALTLLAAITACGGGGGGGDTPGGGVIPTPDARNGDYQMYAADARQYTLSLDFDADTYRVTGNGQDLRGTISEVNTAGKFVFDPAGTAPAAPNAPQFSIFSETVVGNYRLPSGSVPFIASRSFVNTLADAAGTYNFLTTLQDTAAAPNNAIFTGEILASGTLRTCNDNTIYKISLCPTASVTTSTLTFSVDHFTADTGTGTFPFRIAKVGTDRVFLRASPASATARRYWVGMVEAPFTDGTFAGANTNGQATSTTLTSTSYNANWSEAAANFIKIGTVNSIAGTIGPSGIVVISTAGDGGFFAISNSNLLALVAARGSTAWPGYVEIGKR